MRFSLIDRITSYEPDVTLTAVKNVSLAEEYLGDHFPEFPVLPGVLMIEGATQAAAWLLRLSEDYAHSMIVLAEAKSVKFTGFVQPGRTLAITVERIKREGRTASFKFQGEVEGQTCVSGRLVLECYNLADENPALAGLDERMKAHQRATEAIYLRGATAPEPAH